MNRKKVASVGTEIPERSFGPVAQSDIARFAGAGGDFNPLHLDLEVAQQAGFERPIAMGQMSAGLLAGWVTDWCGVENLRSFSVRFVAPISIGDTVTFSGHVESIDQDSQLAELEISAHTEKGPAVKGHAQIAVRLHP